MQIPIAGAGAKRRRKAQAASASRKPQGQAVRFPKISIADEKLRRWHGGRVRHTHTHHMMQEKERDKNDFTNGNKSVLTRKDKFLNLIRVKPEANNRKKDHNDINKHNDS